jgi:hypothetical protein
MTAKIELRKSLVRTTDQVGRTVWYHAVPNRGRLRLRQVNLASPLSDPTDVDPAAWMSEFPSTEQFLLSQIEELTHLSASDYPIDSPGAWSHVAERLDECLSSARKPVVPTTALRDLYLWLRLNPNLELHAALAAGFADRPKGLAEIVAKSRDQFATYRNADRYLAIDATRERLVYDRSAPFGSGRDVAAALHSIADPLTDTVVVDDRELDFRIVAREIDPRRTVGGVFETGESASSSGIGGADLLLCSRAGRPIVGEIKRRNDTNAFMALVQALMYMVEFATPNQVTRLATSFSEHFGGLADLGADVRCDLFLVSADAPVSGLPPVIGLATQRLAEGLVEERCISVFLGRIAFLEVVRAGLGDVVVMKKFLAEAR